MLNEKQVEDMTRLAVDLNALNNQLHVIATSSEEECMTHIRDAAMLMQKCLGSLKLLADEQKQKLSGSKSN